MPHCAAVPAGRQGRTRMLELYNFKQSTCSQKVRFCLAEKGLEWTDRLLDSRKSEQLQPEYLKLNPNGLVPTLVHDGNVIIDSSVIMEYLDEVFPETPMVPRDAVKRAWCRKWLRYFEEVPTPAIRYPSFQKFLIRSFEKLGADEFDEAARKRPLRTDFYRRMGTDGFSERDMQAAMDNLQQAIDRVDAAVGDTGGPWIMGDMLTVADA
jgi:glutathione S-transferase